MNEAQEVQGINVLRTLLEDLSVQLLCLGQSAVLMVRECDI
jgi:hypothetical protein